MSITTSPVSVSSPLLTFKQGTGAALPAGKTSPEDAFLAQAHKTPAQRMQESILKSLGITPEEYESMDPQARKAVDEKIAQMMKQRIEEQQYRGPGLLVDQFT